MTPEERKAIAKRIGQGWAHPDYRPCGRYYPKCCAYHEGFDDALALLVEMNKGWHRPRVFTIEGIEEATP